MRRGESSAKRCHQRQVSAGTASGNNSEMGIKWWSDGEDVHARPEGALQDTVVLTSRPRGQTNYHVPDAAAVQSSARERRRGQEVLDSLGEAAVR